MEVLKSEYKLCLLCMEEHEVKTVQITEEVEQRGKEICFKAIYEYCELADELLETEEMIRINSHAMKVAF